MTPETIKILVQVGAEIALCLIELFRNSNFESIDAIANSLPSVLKTRIILQYEKELAYRRLREIQEQQRGKNE